MLPRLSRSSVATWARLTSTAPPSSAPRVLNSPPFSTSSSTSSTTPSSASNTTSSRASGALDARSVDLSSPYTLPTKQGLGTSRHSGLRAVLLGAPGSGKGSFGKFIAHYFQVPIVSTGDLIRAEIKRQSPLGKDIQSLAAAGTLVGDDVVFALLQDRLQQADTQSGFILDGFPRRLTQAETLAKVFPSPAPATGIASRAVNCVLNISLREDVLVRKAVARRVCDGCGAGYNVAHVFEGTIRMPAILPRTPNACDACGGPLVQRADDTEETIRRRLAIYHEHAAPLLDFYARQGLLLQWDICNGLEDVPRLVRELDTLLLRTSTAAPPAGAAAAATR